MQLFNLNGKNIKVTLIDSDLTDGANNYFFEIIVNKNKLKDMLVNLLLLQDKTVVDNFSLTRREKQVLKFLSLGKNNAEIAESMHVSVHTAKVHIHNIFSKLSVQDRTEAVVKAIKYKLIDI